LVVKGSVVGGSGDRRPFVGRQQESDRVAEALVDALGGRGRLMLLAGEPGIGKTRLADEATTAAAREGVPVLWGRCWESGGAPAYWPWLEVLPPLVRALDDQTLQQALGDGAGLCAELLPDLRARLPNTSSARLSSP
jgi:predicted ATPase